MNSAIFFMLFFFFLVVVSLQNLLQFVFLLLKVHLLKFWNVECIFSVMPDFTFIFITQVMETLRQEQH